MLSQMITRTASGGRSYSRRMDSTGLLGSLIPDMVVGAPSHSISGRLSAGPAPRRHPALPDAHSTE